MNTPAVSPLLLGAILTHSATRLEMAVATPTGEIVQRTVHRARVPLGPDELVVACMQSVAELVGTATPPDAVISGCGVALEGVIDATTALVLDLPPLMGWVGIPLESRLAQHLGVLVAVETLTNAALRGEMRWGAGRDVANVAFIETSRTIGAAIAFDGHVMRRPYLGALGHLPLVVGGSRCACGGYGHLETFASAQSLVRMMIGRLVESPTTEAQVMAITGERAEALTVAQIWQLACSEERVARELMQQAISGIATAILMLLLAVDVERVVIGGALAQCGASWLTALRTQLTLLAPPSRATALAERIVLSELGTTSALRGVLALANERAVVP